LIGYTARLAYSGNIERHKNVEKGETHFILLANIIIFINNFDNLLILR